MLILSFSTPFIPHPLPSPISHLSPHPPTHHWLWLQMVMMTGYKGRINEILYKTKLYEKEKERYIYIYTYIYLYIYIYM